MKRYFCKQCSGILQKGKMHCIRCGYDNPELIPEFSYALKRRLVIRRIVIIAAIVGAVIILHANYLFPWQGQTFNNKWAIMDYAKEHFLGAKAVGHDYETAEFDPWRSPIDRIVFELDGVRFMVSAEDGKVIGDSYWAGVGEKLVYDKYLAPFLEGREIKFKYHLSGFGFGKFIEEEPHRDISQFDGYLDISLVVEAQKGTPELRDTGWAYDFYCHCRTNIDLQNYNVIILYEGDHITQKITFCEDSVYTDSDAFYADVETYSH